MIVTIDGGVASGKSAVGKRVADALGLPFIDSGLMYRAITRLGAERGIDPHDSVATTALAHSTVLKIALPVISATPGVREALVAQQRRMGEHGVVMAGRDIGTVVFPNADHKFFLTASLAEKVRRRAAQYERRGEAVDEDAMRKEVELRDRVDSERAVAPLRPADDAVVINTDDLSLEDVVDTIITEIEDTVGGE